MRGSIHSQIEGLYHTIAKGIGESRHQIKETGAADTKIHSDNSRKTYLSTWHQIAEFARDNHSIRHIEKITPEVVQEWLQARVNRCLAPATVAKDVAAIGKFGEALNQYSEKFKGGETTYDFSARFDVTREAVQNKIDENNPWSGKGRAYEDPEKLINNIKDEAHQLAARIQFEGGCRAEGVGFARSEYSIASISAENLRGIKADRFFAGKLVGEIVTTEKGGKTSSHYITPETYRRLESYISVNGPLRGDYHGYLRSINQAARSTGQHIEGRGTHAFKHNFAASFYREAVKAGKSDEEAKAELSERLSHERGDVADTYYLGR